MKITDIVRQTIAYHDELNPHTWNGDTMNPLIRDRLIEIANLFISYLEIPKFDVIDIVLTGSIVNYNWTDFSDYDLHIVTDFRDLECDDIAEAFYKAKKTIWNNNHDITIFGHEVELYVEDVNEPPVSAGMYSILKDQWIKEPVKETPSIDRSAINAKVTDLIKQIRSADSAEDLLRLRDKLRKMRRTGLDQHGEFGVDNLSFKVLRNLGYLDQMNDTVLNQQDQDLSLD